jgi:hypothetical protein
MFKILIIILIGIILSIIGIQINAGSLYQGPTKVSLTFIQYAGGESFNYVYATRNIPSGTLDILGFILDQEILGPSNNEKIVKKYKSSFILTGQSNCGGKNYTKSILSNNLTVKFCREIVPYVYPGGVSGSSLKAAGRTKTSLITALRYDKYPYIKGYQGINKVKILDNKGKCFAPDVEVANEIICD